MITPKSMDKTGLIPVKNSANNIAGFMFRVIDTKMIRNNGFGNFAPSNVALRKSFNDEANSDRKGKRKIVNEIDFFSSEKRKMPKLELGSASSPISRIKEEDITLQIGLQFTENNEQEEKLQQANKRMAHELEAIKAKLRRIREEKSSLTKELNGLKNMMTDDFRENNNYYRIALLHKGHQGNPVISRHTVKRVVLERQHKENYQVSETNHGLPRV